MTTTERTEIRLWHSLPRKQLRANYHPATRAGRFHQAAMTRQMRSDGFNMGREEKCEWQKARITYVFHHWKKIDLVENWVVGLKGFVDGLVDAGIVPDDDADHLVPGEHDYVKCVKGDEGVLILVQKLA